jgi:hypothetical protein
MTSITHVCLILPTDHKSVNVVMAFTGRLPMATNIGILLIRFA